MTQEQLCAILLARGYQQIESPDRAWRTWLWVAPVREGAIPTKLCQGLWNLTESGLHALLDQQCECKTEHYTDEQRARTVLRMSTSALPYETKGQRKK